jgi:hypothetical protein
VKKGDIYRPYWSRPIKKKQKSYSADFKQEAVRLMAQAKVEREIRAWSLEVRDIVSASSSAEETLFGLRKFYGVVKERDKDAALLIAEARLYAARNGQFKSKLSALFREVHEELKSVLERFQTEAGIKNGIPADQLVLIAIALNQGLAMHHLMDPRHYPNI